IGFGDVGAEIAKRLRAFNAKIIGVGRREIKTSLLDEYYMINSLNTVLSKSDIVILTLPYTRETNHLIDAKRIKVMKDDSILINVSRGGILSELALIEALKQDKFLGVALDVFEKEPLTCFNPMWEFKRLTITPHNSFVSDKIHERLIELCIKNLKRNIEKA